MLVLQIAAGVVLAVLVVRFWRQWLVLAGVLAVVDVIALLILWLDEGRPASEVVIHLIGGLLIGGAVVRWVVGKVQSHRQRAVIEVEDI